MSIYLLNLDPNNKIAYKRLSEQFLDLQFQGTVYYSESLQKTGAHD
jgi:hypothetical protein